MRLSNLMRKSIAKRAEEDTFKERREALDELRVSVVEKVLDRLPNKKIPQIFVDEGWIDTSGEIRLFTSDHSGTCRDVDNISIGYEVPVKCNQDDLVVSSVNNPREAELLKGYVKKRSALDEEVKEFKKTLEKILNSCSTTKQVEEVMPELVQYFPTEKAYHREVVYAIVSMEEVEKMKKLLRVAKKA